MKFKKTISLVLLLALTAPSLAVTVTSGGGGGMATTDIDTSAELKAILTDETGSGAAVFATSPTLVTPLLGTPTNITLTNGTGLPISSGVSGLGTGVATVLATPSSANLAAAITDETGSGAAVFATSPTLTTPTIAGATATSTVAFTPPVNTSAITSTGSLNGSDASSFVSWTGTWNTSGNPTALKLNITNISSGSTSNLIDLQVGGASKFLVDKSGVLTGTLTNCTGLPISSGISGLGTGVATFLATPSGANLASALTTKQGTGVPVFDTSPTITTPILSVPVSIGSGATISVLGGTDRLAFGTSGSAGNQYLYLNSNTPAMTLRSGWAMGWSSSATDIVNNAADTSLSRASANNVGFNNGSPSGTTYCTVGSNGVRTTAGAVATPSYTYTAETGLGFFRRAPGVQSFAAGGFSIVEMWYDGSTSGLRVNNTTPICWGSSTADTAQDTAFLRATPAVVSVEGASSVGGTVRFIAKTATQITSSQNDYNPGGRSKFQRWSSDASRNVTGLVFASAGVDGEEHVVVNVGSQNIVLVNESASSTAANRFTTTTAADLTLSANQMAYLIYDGTTSRWRVSKLP